MTDLHTLAANMKAAAAKISANANPNIRGYADATDAFADAVADKLEPVAPPPPPPSTVTGPFSSLTQAAADAMAGKNLQLKTPGQGIAAASGKVTLRCTVQMLAANTVIASNIILKRDARHTLDAMVEVSADDCGAHCEIDGSSMKCQGVHLGTLVAAIKRPNTSGLWVHDIVEGAFVSPQKHGVYCSSCDGWVGDGMKFERVSGYGIQYNGAPVGPPINSRVSRVAADHCWGGVVFWDGAANNAVSKALITNCKGAPAVSGKTLATNPKVDYVTVPTPGYGYV